MRTKLLGVVLAALFVGVAWAGQGKLDGKNFKVMVTEPDQKTYADTLTFKHGSFDSSECAKFGFKPTAYSGDGETFTATAKSAKEGTAEWSGTIKGDQVQGKLVWTKAGQPTYTYTFAGTTPQK